MNKEELIGKLQMVYIGDINALNEMIGYYDGLKEVIEMVQQENKELHNKIDKAIKYINDRMIVEQSFCLDSKQCYELIEILKDSDVDE